MECQGSREAAMDVAEYPLDPFPHYERMRATAPVFEDDQSGSWHVFRYDDVQRVLSEHAALLVPPGGRQSVRLRPTVCRKPDYHRSPKAPAATVPGHPGLHAKGR